MYFSLSYTIIFKIRFKLGYTQNFDSIFFLLIKYPKSQIILIIIIFQQFINSLITGQCKFTINEILNLILMEINQYLNYRSIPYILILNTCTILFMIPTTVHTNRMFESELLVSYYFVTWVLQPKRQSGSVSDAHRVNFEFEQDCFVSLLFKMAALFIDAIPTVASSFGEYAFGEFNGRFIFPVVFFVHRFKNRVFLNFI